MPVTCPNPACGNINRDGARFCSVCRTPLTAGLAPMPGMTGMLPANCILAGRYAIIGKIGQGGMAAVYLVADTRLPGKQWAVKEMSDAAITDPGQKEQAEAMFLREMNLLTQLQHRNIPQVVDTFTEGGKHFIVMEYVDGLTLEQLMRSQGGRPFSEAQVRAWFLQLCDVLDYLHSQSPQIIFRDLKPSNIMVDRSGTVKLIDFGIARFFSPQKAHDTMAFGTAGYAAPEQYGQGQSDPRSDVYGLGATLFRLLTGHDPSTTPMTLPPLERFQVQVSPPMRKAIQCALENDRTRRWKSVREMAGAAGVQVALHGGGGAARVGMAAATAGAQAAGGGPAAVGSGAVAAGPALSRPTTRLLLSAAQMSNRQLAVMVGVPAILLVIATVVLAPRITLEAALAMPVYLLAGPVAYAASHRRGVAMAAHVSVTGLVWLAALLAHVNIEGDGVLFAVGLLLSGLVMEGILAVRRGVAGRGRAAPGLPGVDQAPWWHDCLWLAVAAMAAGLVALGMPTVFGHYNWLRAWFPVSAAVAGALGWFLGDLYHQNMLLKQTGLSRSDRRRP